MFYKGGGGLPVRVRGSGLASPPHAQRQSVSLCQHVREGGRAVRVQQHQCALCTLYSLCDQLCHEQQQRRRRHVPGLLHLQPLQAEEGRAGLQAARSAELPILFYFRTRVRFSSRVADS